MTIESYIGIAVYSLLSRFPYILLALYPVKDKLRVPRGVVVAIILLLYAVEYAFSFSYVIRGHGSADLILLTLIIQISFYMLCIKQPIGQGLFFLFMLAHLGSFVNLAARGMESLLFSGSVMEGGLWRASLCLLVLDLLTLIPLFFYIRKLYIPIIQKNKNVFIWRTLWIIPLTLLAIFGYEKYFTNMTYSEQLLPSHIAFQLFIAFGSLIVYNSIILFIAEQIKNMELNTSQMQLAQYEFIQERIRHEQKERHDFRHHLRVLAAYAEEGNQEELAKYIANLASGFSKNSHITYCENYSVNILLHHYATHADSKEITMVIQVALPAQIGIPCEVLTVLFGNLLENAVEACEKETGNPEINIRCKIKYGILYLHISNTCTQPLVWNETEGFITSKEDSALHGIGLWSVSDIVKEYDGIIEIKTEENTFSVQIVFPIPNEVETSR